MGGERWQEKCRFCTTIHKESPLNRTLNEKRKKKKNNLWRIAAESRADAAGPKKIFADSRLLHLYYMKGGGEEIGAVGSAVNF